MSSRILILTNDDDMHAEHVARLLKQRGADVVRFDPGCFPTRASLSVSLGSTGAVSRVLAIADRAIDLETLTAVWFRRPSRSTVHSGVTDARLRTYVERECAAFTEDLWDGLPCRLVPASAVAMDYAERKMQQLLEAGKAGFECPSTLLTTDPGELLGFFCQHDGEIITKVLGQMPGSDDGAEFGRFTQAVTTRDLGYAAALRLCPVIVQPYVPKALEVRVTVVGDEIFAAEIHSQQSNHTKRDWRRYDRRLTPYRTHDLPDIVGECCRRLVARLGLCYGAIDLILTPDRRYVFLEINPNGQYLWIERATGLRISEALCDLLLSDARAKKRAASAMVAV